eukprot:scaffold43861_cov21-Tisochrysis_lutea.AAC.4
MHSLSPVYTEEAKCSSDSLLSPARLCGHAHCGNRVRPLLRVKRAGAIHTAAWQVPWVRRMRVRRGLAVVCPTRPACWPACSRCAWVSRDPPLPNTWQPLICAVCFFLVYP